jgi:alanyl-tRNA synthetase
MQALTSKQIKQQFYDYYDSKGHTYIESGSTVPPTNDESLLFTNAGMNQFKNIFLGKETVTNARAYNSQRCIRAGGKHNDIDEIGDNTHHTYFQMLGNWSFNDYYKEDAIKYAFELLTDIYKIDKNRLYVTYFGGNETLNLPEDTETKNIWKKYLPDSRILPFDMKDNFWEMAETGPCGPCTEIHYDYEYKQDESKEVPELVNNDNIDANTANRVVEIWNLVFIQYNRTNETTFEKLDKHYVDTGMGFERLVCLLQNKQSNYDTDVFKPLLDNISEITEIESYYKTTDQKLRKSYRIIADHYRTIQIGLVDGIEFGNKGRDYVLRKIFRRCYFHCKFVFDRPKLLEELLEIDNSNGTAFLETEQEIYKKRNKEDVLLTLEAERLQFDSILQKGMRLIKKVLKKNKTFTGFDIT